MRFKKIIFTIIILGIILVPVLVYYFGVSIPTQKYIYESNWDIDIPSNYKSIYQSQDKHDFQGKGNRYTIFTTNEIDNSNLITLQKSSKNIQVCNGNSTDLNHNEIEAFVRAVTSALNIPEYREPKFTHYYLWQKFIQYGKTLVVLYFPDRDQVFFIESLI